MAGESTRAMRPFWMHQIVEYIIGAVFISSGLQSPTPAVPAGLGVAVMLNAAVTHGAGGAFRVMHRQVHRVIDVVIIVLVFVLAVQPVVPIGDNTRILTAMLGVVLAFVWWNTDFATKDERKHRRSTAARRRKTNRPTSEEVGQRAGRLVGDGVKFARRAQNKLRSDSSKSDDE